MTDPFMRGATVWRGAVLAILLLVVAGPASGGDKAPALTEFEAKYLLVVYKGRGSAYLEKVKVQKLGDSHFLTGTGVDVELKGAEWRKGNPVWIAVPEILEITVYATREAIVKAAQSAPKN